MWPWSESCEQSNFYIADLRKFRHSKSSVYRLYPQLGSTENARLENRKLFKILFKLLYLRFPPLRICTCVFRTCVFSRPDVSRLGLATVNLQTKLEVFLTILITKI